MAGENSKRWRGAAFNTPSFVLFFVVGGVAGPNRPVGGGDRDGLVDRWKQFV